MNGPQPRPRRTLRRRLTSWFSDPGYDAQVAADQLAHIERVRAAVAERSRQRARDERHVAEVALAAADPGRLYLVHWWDAGDGYARGMASWLPEDHPAMGD